MPPRKKVRHTKWRQNGALTMDPNISLELGTITFVVESSSLESVPSLTPKNLLILAYVPWQVSLIDKLQRKSRNVD